MRNLTSKLLEALFGASVVGFPTLFPTFLGLMQRVMMRRTLRKSKGLISERLIKQC